MVSYTDGAFAAKCEKVIAKLRTEDNFYLGRFEEDSGPFTVFGNGYIVFTVPMHVGEEKDADRAKSVTKLLNEKFWSDEARQHMRWVPLPDKSELKPGRDKENPVKCHLLATDLEPGREITEGCALYQFSVQARYLKTALQLAPFKGERDVRSAYNPLCLWTMDDGGECLTCVIMPMRE